jgi:hypothetical protein
MANARSEQKADEDLLEAVVMDESQPPRDYVQRGPGFPIMDQFGRKGQNHRNGMDRMTDKAVLEWASESTLRWAKRAYATLYPEWMKTIIISREIDAYWKEYEFRTGDYPDDRIAEIIRFRNRFDRPMYKAEFQHMMRVSRKKLGYQSGEWVGSNYLKAYTAAWTWKNGDPKVYKVEFDHDFTSSEWFLDFHIDHPAKPEDRSYKYHWSNLQVGRSIPIHCFPRHS